MSKPQTIPIEALSQLWEHRETIPLYVFMAINADAAGNFELPPLRKFAKEIGVTRYALEKGLETLIKIGLVSQISAKFQPNFSHAAIMIVNALSVSVSQISAKFQPNFSQISEQKKQCNQDGFERFRDYFNNAVAGTSIPQITKLTDARKNALRSIFKEYGRETVVTVIQKVIASDFLSREWGKVSFDWIFKKSNFIKILEGNYDNRAKPITTTDNAASRAQGRDRLRTLATGVLSRNTNKLLSLYNGSGTDADTRKD